MSLATQLLHKLQFRYNQSQLDELDDDVLDDDVCSVPACKHVDDCSNVSCSCELFLYALMLFIWLSTSPQSHLQKISFTKNLGKKL